MSWQETFVKTLDKARNTLGLALENPIEILENKNIDSVFGETKFLEVLPDNEAKVVEKTDEMLSQSSNMNPYTIHSILSQHTRESTQTSPAPSLYQRYDF